MKLYNVPRGSKIRVVSKEVTIPVASQPAATGDVLDFEQMDGMYSYCRDKDGNVVHLAAWTEVEIVQNDSTAVQNAPEEGEAPADE